MTSISGLFQRFRDLYAPAPLSDFGDYDDYWNQRGEIDQRNRWAIAASLVQNGTSVLDVGAGSGQFIDALLAAHPDIQVQAIDGSETAAVMMRSRGIAATRLDIATEAIEGKYDYVTCLEVLEHIAHAERALHNIMSATRRMAIISIPNVGFIGSRVRLALFGRFPLTTCVYHIREHVRFWTPKDFCEWIEHEGYRVTGMLGHEGISPFYRRHLLFASGVLYTVEK